MYKIFPIVLVLSLVILGCQSEAPVEEILTTADGLEYKMHITSEGEKPKPGDYVEFHVQTRVGDSIMNTSRVERNNQPVKFQIPMANIPGRPPSPVEGVLQAMSIGDSATALLRIDTLPNLPDWLSSYKYVEYDIVLESIQTKEAFKAEVDAMKGEVISIAEQTLKDYKEKNLGDQIAENRIRLRIRDP